MRRHPGFLRQSEVRAYADGRRLREEAMRQGRRRARPMNRPPGGPHRPNLATVPLLLLLALFFAGQGMAAGGIAVGMTPLLLLFVVAVAAQRGRRSRIGPPPAAPRVAPVAAPRPDLGWAQARQRFHQLRAGYAAFECDPMQVLRLPALADVSVPSTARFVDAFAEAQALESDRFPGPEHANRFVAAVEHAERSWRAAHDAAGRIRLSTLTPAERATVDRVLKLLTTARDSDSEPERLAAYTRARTELAKLDQAGVVHVPLPAQAALDVAARVALPGAT